MTLVYGGSIYHEWAKCNYVLLEVNAAQRASLHSCFSFFFSSSSCSECLLLWSGSPAALVRSNMASPFWWYQWYNTAYVECSRLHFCGCRCTVRVPGGCAEICWRSTNGLFRPHRLQSSPCKRYGQPFVTDAHALWQSYCCERWPVVTGSIIISNSIIC